MERRIKIYTGVGGMDLFEEVFEEHAGFKRVHIDKTPPRFLRDIVKFRKNRAGRYYRLLRTRAIEFPIQIYSLKEIMEQYSFTSYKIAP